MTRSIVRARAGGASRPSPDALDVPLVAVPRAYLRQVRAWSYRGLCATQRGPWASIGYGAAGIATALVCGARRDHRARDLGIAARWLADAARGSRAVAAFWTPGFGERRMGASLYYGPDGVHFVHLLGASRGPRDDGAALTAFLARCRRRRGGPSELVEGVAGTLTALVLLHRRTGDPRVLRVADELAADLLARADGAAGWGKDPNLGFAHGRAGTLHALLGWSLAAARELPAAFGGHLDRLAADAARAGLTTGGRARDDAEGAALRRSWCNGAAGLVLLWARAYQHAPEAAYLRRAREAARLLETDTAGAPGNLCCGLGGRAYGLLAMERIDPGHGWLARAQAMGARAVAAMLDTGNAWPNGLFTGYPGLVCLAHDLAAAPGERLGFPLVEGA
ncbi:MAG: hypothetical protein K8W52_05705 [Deltaproteobacteria bacterium]|nr:hypothetical protein [Deltaproteobacteria bacterium]